MAPAARKPPVGWYPDPAGAPEWRWWDGYRWTEYTHANSPGWYPRGMGDRDGVDEPATWQQNEAALFPWARWAVLDTMAVDALGTVEGFADRNVLLRFHRYLQQGLAQAGGPGYLPPLPPHFPAGYRLIQLLGLVVVAGNVIFLLWQYRAARTARALRYRARHGPGWGVGAWFVPVVNLWIPYQSLADCLPPAHPVRRGLVWLPLAYFLGLPAASLAWEVAAFFGVGWAPLLVPAAVSVALAGFVGWRGWRFVTAVHRDHEASVVAQPAGGGGC